MKKNLLIAIALLCYSVSFSQSFNYQAVVRDAAGDPVTNQSMGVLVRIIAGSPTGSVLYNEGHTVTSNDQGVITLPVGGGTSGANFLAIDWSTQNHWIDIQVDLSGGTSYTQIGTSELRFVPYAMYALNSNQAGNAGVFAINSNVVSNGNGNNLTDDFVFGASQLDHFSSNSPFNARMFYDKSKRAFRAGFTFGNAWDEGNIGDYSVGFGEGGVASGRNSFSMGRNANATGNESFAFGLNAGGFADYAKGFGLNARAFGQHATAIGRQLSANSMAEIQLGQYSNFVSGSTDTWVPTDRLFVIGNGQEDINLALNSDALVMLKNGNTTLNGQLTIDGDNQGAGAAFTFPAQDGTANQIMQTDGAGNVTWVTPAVAAIPNGGTNGYVLSTDGSGVLSWITNEDTDADPTNEIELPVQTGESGKFLTTNGTIVAWQDVPNEIPTGGTDGQILTTNGSGVYSWEDQTATAGFSTTGNVTSNASGDTTTDDFVFGSTQIDDIAGLDDNNRIVFDKSKGGAFRAGSAFNTPYFNQDQLGGGSVGFGVNNQATGSFAATMGYFNDSSGYASFTAGDFNTASGTSSTSLGANNTSEGAYSFSIGQRLTSESLAQITLGTNNTAVAGDTSAFVGTDRLFVLGNGVDTANKSDAVVVLKNGNTTINGTLTIDGDNQEMEAGYTFPAQDGTANQVMTTDGSGTVSWTDAASGGSGAFSTTTNVTSNTSGDIATDDFVFGSTQLADDASTFDDNIRMFFDKSKGAFRAGYAQDAQWDDANVGPRSVAFGNQNVTSALQTFAMGAQNTVSAPTSATFGTNNNITGIGTFSTGQNLTAEARNQVTIGYLNTVLAGNPLNRVLTDRLFVIGNGFDEMNRSDALVMLKNGNTTLNGQLTIDGDNAGSGNAYTLPAQDGTANQVMTTDGSGNASWVDQPMMIPSTFSTTSNVTSNANGTIATDDFVFGSTQLANDINTTDDDRRMYFDKSKAAFRAGRVSGTQYDETNVGDYSAGFGLNTTASGTSSFVAGNNSSATATNSVAIGSNANASSAATVAIGSNSTATGLSAIAVGSGVTASGSSSMTWGNNLTAESFSQISLGLYNTSATPLNANNFQATDRLMVIGNGTEPSSRSDAMVMLKNGNTTLNGQLTIDGDNTGSGASYTLPAQDGTASQVMTTDGSGNISWAAVAAGTMLPSGGTDGQLLKTDGSGNYAWVTDAVNDADNDPTNEIELPTQAGQSGKMLSTDGTSPSWVDTPSTLPSQTGESGKVLSTDGTNASWVADAVNDADSDPTNEIELPTQTGQSGKILTTNGTATSWVDVPTELPAGGTTGQVLKSDGSGGSTWSSDIEATSVKIPNLPAFNVTKASASVYTAAGPHEVGSWSTSLNGDLFNDGAHLNLTNGRFTAPVDGLYFFSAQVRIDGVNIASSYSRLMIAKNGNKQGFANGLHSINNSDTANGFYHTQHVSGILKLNAGDYVTVLVETTLDPNYTVQTESGFSGYLVNKL